MKCKKCGAENFDGVNFCDKCGTQLTNSQKTTKKKSIIVVAIVAVIAITIGIILSMQSGITNSLEHHLQLGYKYLQEGQYEEAILAFDKVISIDEKNIEARFGKIEAYVALGEAEKAEEVRQELLNIGISSEQLKEYTFQFTEKLGNNSNIFYSCDAYSGAIATDSNVISVNENGIYLRSFSSSTYEKVFSGNFEYGNVVTNGAVAYFVDRTDNYIKELNLYTKTTENLVKTNQRRDYETPDVMLLGCAGDNLYFDETYAFDDTDLYIFNLKTKEYNKSNNFIGDIIGNYNNEIYFNTSIHSGDFAPWNPLGKTDFSGNNRENVIEDGLTYTMIGSSIYYPVLDHENYSLTEIKILNLESGNIKTIVPKYNEENSYPTIEFFEEGFGIKNFETDSWYYENYSGETIDMDGKVIKWTSENVIYE